MNRRQNNGNKHLRNLTIVMGALALFLLSCAFVASAGWNAFFAPPHIASGWWQALGSFLAVGVGALSAILLYFNLEEAQKMSAEARRQGDIASAAIDAHILVDKIEIQENKAFPDHYDIWIHVQNVGQTPALDLQWACELRDTTYPIWGVSPVMTVPAYPPGVLRNGAVEVRGRKEEKLHGESSPRTTLEIHGHYRTITGRPLPFGGKYVLEIDQHGDHRFRPSAPKDYQK